MIGRSTKAFLWAPAIICGLLLGVEGRARCDDAVAGEALFQEGKRLLKEGQIAAACPKFAESQRLDPSSGTMLNLAACHEREGKTASAWAEFLAAARLARAQNRADRAIEAEKRAAELTTQLSYLRIELSSPQQNLTVLRDGTRLDQGAFGTRIPIDPGEHEIKAQAPGYRVWSQKVIVDKGGDTKVITVPVLTPEPSDVTTVPSSAPAAPSRSLSPVASSPVSVKPAPQSSNALAYVIGGVGIVAAGVGATFGVLALSAYNDAESQCPTYKSCGADAMDKRDLAGTRATIANVGIGVGVAGIGIATVLLLLKGSKESGSGAEKVGVRATPVLGVGHAGAGLTGQF